MTVLMDDPTTYLVRDAANVAIVLAGNIQSAMDICRAYGVAIQVQMPGGIGIRVVSTHLDAINAAAVYPATTPWCIITDGLWQDDARKALRSFFGPPKTIADALAVHLEGIAWGPEMTSQI